MMEIFRPAENDGGSYLVSDSLSLNHLCVILSLVALSSVTFFGYTRKGFARCTHGRAAVVA